MDLEQRTYLDMEKKFSVGVLIATDFLIEKSNYNRFSMSLIQAKYDYLLRTKMVDFYLGHTSTKNAPWFVIPADDKQYAHQLIGKIILEKLKSMKPAFPPTGKKEKVLMREAKAQLVIESK